MSDVKEEQNQDDSGSEDYEMSSHVMSISDFTQGVAYIKALYARIPKTDLVNHKDVPTYLQRLSRLQQSCPNKLKFWIHYPDATEQTPTEKVQRVIFNPDTKFQVKNTDGSLSKPKLTSSQQEFVKMNRSNAIIVLAQTGTCRVTKFDHIPDDHTEILFVLALSMDVATQFLNHVIPYGKNSIFAEVPAVWDGYFHSAGFEQKTSHDFGNLLPKHSSLHIWVLPIGKTEEEVKSIYPGTLGEQLKFPVDSDIKHVTEPVLPKSLVVNADVYPDDAKQALGRFFNDHATLMGFGRDLTGNIAQEDGASIRMVLSRMFEFAKIADPNTGIWPAMLEAESLFAEFGIIADPSTQTWYAGIVDRNNVQEIRSNLLMMRGFATSFPRFASQQIKIEANLRSSMTTTDEKMASRDFMVQNITNAGDFDFLPNLDSFATIKMIHARMRHLRSVWRGRHDAITRAIAAIRTQAQTQSPSAVDTAPSIALEKRDKELIRNGQDTEGAFQRILTFANKDLSNSADQANVVEWIAESRASANEFQSMTVDTVFSADPNTPITLAPAPNTNALAAKLLASSQQEILASNQPNSSERSQLQAAGVELKIATPIDATKLQTMMDQFNRDLETLATIERNRKNTIRNNMNETATKALGVSTELQQLSGKSRPDLSHERQKELRDIIDRSKQCHLQLLTVIADPRFKTNVNNKEEDKVTEHDVMGLNNVLVSHSKCLSRYYDTLQLFDKSVEEDYKSRNGADNREALAIVNRQITQAQVAIAEATNELENIKNGAFVVDFKQVTDNIATMKSKCGLLVQFQMQLQDASEQPLDVSKAITKQKRDEILAKCKQELVEIVRLRLDITKTHVQQTDQYRLLQAIRTNQQKIDEAAEQARISAELAKEHLKKQEIAELARNRLGELAAVIQSPDRHVTASFAELAKQTRKKEDHYRLALMQLVSQLETDMQDGEPHHVVLKDLNAINAFLQMHEASLVNENYDQEKERIGRAVTDAKRLLKREDSKRTTHVNELHKIRGLRKAANDGDLDAVRNLLNQIEDVN